MGTSKELSTNELYELLVKANEEQTKDIKEQIQRSTEIQNETIRTLSGKLEKLSNRCLYLERKSRKNNIIIFGLKINDDKLLANETIAMLNNLLGLNYYAGDINNIYKIGKDSNPPIVVEFISFLRKIEIFKDAEKLKKLKEKNIAISNDLCEEDRQDQKLLRRHLKDAREKKLNANIKGNKLEINKVLYTISQLKNGDIDLENNISDSEVDTSQEEEENAVLEQNQANSEISNERVKIRGREEGDRIKKKERRKQDKTPSPTLKTYRSTRKK